MCKSGRRTRDQWLTVDSQKKKKTSAVQIQSEARFLRHEIKLSH
jgi:hypothetical protein